MPKSSVNLGAKAAAGVSINHIILRKSNFTWPQRCFRLCKNNPNPHKAFILLLEFSV